MCLLFRYQQKFDLEGNTGIVVRGIGTAIHLTKIESTATPAMPRLVQSSTSVSNLQRQASLKE